MHNPAREHDESIDNWKETLGIALAILIGVPVWMLLIGVMSLCITWEWVFNKGAMYGAQSVAMNREKQEGIALTVLWILLIAAGVVIGMAPLVILLYILL